MSAVITLKSFELYNGVQEVEATREIASSFRSLNILQSRNIHRLCSYREHTCKSWFLFCLFRGGELLQMEAIQPVRCCRNKMSWLFFSLLGGFMWSVVSMEYDGSCILKKSFTIWIYLQEAKHPALFDRSVGGTSRGGRERRSRAGGREQRSRAGGRERRSRAGGRGKDCAVRKSVDGYGGSSVCNRQQQYLSLPRLLLHNFCRENLELKQRWYRASLLHRPRILLREVVSREVVPQQELKEMAEKKFADRHRF